MIKRIIVIGVLFFTTVAFSQFYISTSAGYAIGSAEVKLGEISTLSTTENSYGSYGEGINLQFRAGYFFNEIFGVDLGIGYLYGSDQTVVKVDIPTRELNVIARARAFGVSPSIVYKFTDNLYGRFGALLKVGGKTEAVVFSKQVFSDDEATALQLPLGSYSETNYKEDFRGKLPLGFGGAFGYKVDFNKSMSLFIEAEYIGISVKRKESELSEFNTDVFLPDGTVAVRNFFTLDNLPEGFNRTTTYVDNLPNNNTDSSIKIAQRVPYSSFGINVGITLNLKNK
ncbi:outer membrane beta-barrel protein [Psychroserpens sp.]